jgi:hypothetical protein
MYKYTRTASVFLIAIAFSIASTVDASLSPPKVARTSSGEINADHIHNLLRQRRLKSSKGNQGSGSDNDEAKSSKQGNTGTGGGGTATGSDNFNKVINIPILGSGGTISGNPNGGGGGGGDDEESQDGGGDEVDMTTPNRGDEENTEEMTGGGSDNAGTINAGLDCGKNIPTAGGPNETEECNGSCECQDSCCIQHVARFCAPRGDNGMSTFGGGFMPCI